MLLKKLSSQKDSFAFNEITLAALRYTDHQNGLPLDKKQIKTTLSKIEHYHSVFSEREIALELFKHLNESEIFTQALRQLKSCPELLSLGLGADGREHFTTKSLFELENKILQLSEALSHQVHRKLPKKQLALKLQSYEVKHRKKFTQEQRSVISYLLKPLGLTCLVGRAGTGKSFSLGVLREIWEEQGVNVHGVTLSGIAASNLTKEAGFKASTIASFLLQAKENPLLIKKNDVIVMDEAGMSDSQSMHDILNLAKHSQANVALIGDPQQIQPVGPGATFRAIVERIGFSELQTVYRQNIPWQQEATRNLSQGNVSPALKSYADNSCLHLDETKESAIRQLVNDWFDLHKKENAKLDNYVVIAHRNQDVDLLNDAIRKKRVQENEIEKGSLVTTAKGNLSLSVGDRLLFLANDSRLQVKNGQFANVISLNRDSDGKIKQLTVQLDGDQRYLTLDPQTYAAFSYGYAATVHKTQGITVDHSLVYVGGKSWNRHLTYVAISRHRKSCHLYADKETHSSIQILSKRLGRLGLKDSTLDYPRAFARQRNIEPSEKQLIKQLASRLRERIVPLIAFFQSLKSKTKTLTKESEIENLSHPDPKMKRLFVKYIEMELSQEENLVLLCTIKDHALKRDIQEKIIQQGKAIQAYANFLLNQVKSMTANEEVQLNQGISINKLGGLLPIKNRMNRGIATSQDIKVIIFQAKQRAQTYQQSFNRKQQQGKML